MPSVVKQVILYADDSPILVTSESKVDLVFGLYVIMIC